MTDNLIGKFIELKESDRMLLERLASAVEMERGTTFEYTVPDVRLVGFDRFGRPQFEKGEARK